tara:strand:+ start:54635 stop:55177 length:543 start_codon:yes stop_codon:yes gene_type:complete
MKQCVFFPGLKTEKYASNEYFYEKIIHIQDVVENKFVYQKTGSGYGSYKTHGLPNKPRLLHVEDNQQISLLLNLYLKDKYEIESVSTGEEALAQLNRKSYDLIIVDIQLGDGMNGFETSREIRSNPRYRDIPIIALTTNEYNNIREDCMRSMVNAYIRKPFTKPYLLTAIYELEKYLSIT